MNMLKLFIKQIKSHSITITFFIIGYLLSILIFSIGVSNIIHMKNLIVEQNQGIYKDTLNVYISSSKDINFENVIDSFSNISSYSRIRVTSATTYVNDESDEYRIIAEYYKTNSSENFPIIKGRYYTADEVKYKKKVALVGKDFEKYIYSVNNIKKIKLGSDEYEVIGIIGYKNKVSTWDDTIFMPLTSLPENSKLNCFKNNDITFLLISEKNKETYDISIIKEKITKKDSNALFNVTRTNGSQNVFLNIINNNLGFIYLAVVLLGFSVINIINISYFWISERKKEMAIRKCFGINNKQIFLLLFLEFFSVTFITANISLFIQFILSLLIKKIFGYYLYLSWENFMFIFFIAIISALLTIIIPTIKVAKVSPVDALKL